LSEQGDSKMKKLSAFLALVTLFFAGFVLANTATLTSVTGTVQAATGTAPARALRVGDVVRQGDTLVTGQASSAVLKFEDGQIAALTANSRMTITAYQYNPTSQSGNVLLSLIDGGMRAITGLIGRRSPDNVAYRAATATIGIRGTDVTIVVSGGGNVIVTVTEGVISFAFPGKATVNIPAGEGVNARTDGSFQQGAIATILAGLTPAERAAFGGIGTLGAAISQAASGVSGSIPAGSTGSSAGNPAGPPGGGGGGGGVSP
jgi:hypothetical protein